MVADLYLTKALYLTKDRKPQPATYTCRAGRCHSFEANFQCHHTAAEARPWIVRAPVGTGVDVDAHAERLARELLRLAAVAAERRAHADEAAFGSAAYRRAHRNPLA